MVPVTMLDRRAVFFFRANLYQLKSFMEFTPIHQIPPAHFYLGQTLKQLS